MPSRYDGVGLKSWEQAANFAWFTSIASCIALADPDLDFARRFLGKRGEDAYVLVLDAIGGHAYLDKSKHELIPAGEPDVLSDSTFYQDLRKDAPKLKLQHEFSDLVCSRAHRHFVSFTDHTNTSEKILLNSQGPW